MPRLPVVRWIGVLTLGAAPGTTAEAFSSSTFGRVNDSGAVAISARLGSGASSPALWRWEAALARLREKLGLPPSRWVRTSEAEYSRAGLTAASIEDEILDAMAAHPLLVERPIAIRGLRAVVGRPPERVLELLA